MSWLCLDAFLANKDHERSDVHCNHSDLMIYKWSKQGHMIYWLDWILHGATVVLQAQHRWKQPYSMKAGDVIDFNESKQLFFWKTAGHLLYPPATGLNPVQPSSTPYLGCELLPPTFWPFLLFLPSSFIRALESFLLLWRHIMQSTDFVPVDMSWNFWTFPLYRPPPPPHLFFIFQMIGLWKLAEEMNSSKRFLFPDERLFMWYRNRITSPVKLGCAVSFFFILKISCLDDDH